jgi:hypothetical protein
MNPLVCIVDGSEQFVERRRILDWPGAVERWTQSRQVAPGKQTHGYDTLSHDKLRNLIYVTNAPARSKCLAFHLRIVRAG